MWPSFGPVDTDDGILCLAFVRSLYHGTIYVGRGECIVLIALSLHCPPPFESHSHARTPPNPMLRFFFVIRAVLFFRALVRFSGHRRVFAGFSEKQN